MAQFYTLEESAQRLGITQEDFKRRLKLEWTSIRPFRDGATLRFRAADIDELARTLGAASDPGLPLGPVGSPPKHDAPLGLSSDDELTLPSGDSGILGGIRKKKSGSDSDVRLDFSSRPKSDPESTLPTEEISLDISGGSGVLKSPSSSRLSAPKSGTNLSGPGSSKIPSATSGSGTTGPDSSSEFELSLDADSDSFELTLNSDSSDEVDLGAFDMAPQSKGPQSGINLGKPSDSGVSLEKKGAKTGPLPKSKSKAEESDEDFELALESGPPSGVRLAGPKSGRMPTAEDSSSEFELTLDDNSGVVESLAEQAEDSGKGDIFETDFELPIVADESGSEVVDVDDGTDLENTGFEVDLNDMDAPADDDSASQVVLVDADGDVLLDDDAMTGAELEDGASASGALRNVRNRDRDDDDGPVRTIVATPPKWGPLPAIVLFLCLAPIFIGVMMTFEIVASMKGYSQGTKPAGLFSRGLAETFGMKIND